MFWILGALVFWGLVIFLTGYRKTPATPPFKHAVLRKGTYLRDGSEIKLFDGGWRFFLLYPWWSKPVIFDTSDKNYNNQKVEEVRTEKDRVDSTIFYDVTWYVAEKWVKDFLRACGGVDKTTVEEHFDKVQKILHGNISQAIRELAAREDQEPNTWEEAVALASKFAEYVVNNVVDQEAITEEERNNILNGSGQGLIKKLGIKIKRFKISKVVPDPAIEKGKEAQTEVGLQTQADLIKTQRRAQQVEALKATGVSPDRAIDAVQAQQGEATKSTTVLDIPQLGSVAEKLLELLFGKKV
ncbi:MAG: hypothetical protein UV58_C0002G0059 [Candidatus Wolfebacteria bacterium GW2011_GWC1_43_10]|uniref:Band 7 domain-containing protein n=1 Tax=Candidatus Wolfebacteria bacterium GW2011_GWC1_43_10 TaxID=1619011 RepID=A0A0G1CCA4_9BACT|nr:MAG: hypothetical protein UV58_C0002G0059 [Candidatus Wolfebacteria bacterium GW2011_GWC1_43_10]KKT23106.1 MAG: hypothetical protein UW08_C0001G0069 [Parcubacteria group bacterium GW2011_GWB1_43_8b]